MLGEPTITPLIRSIYRVTKQAGNLDDIPGLMDRCLACKNDQELVELKESIQLRAIEKSDSALAKFDDVAEKVKRFHALKWKI